MIQVNLLPGASRKRARKMPQIAGLGAISRFKFPQMDRLALAGAATWLIMVPLTGYMFLSERTHEKELATSIEGAIADSTRYANLIAANQKLMERRDTIAQKVEIIQKIDAGRYTWAHILDELSRALPPYTWLVEITPMPADSSETTPRFQLQGRAGNNFALTKYMQDLEASPFVKNVRLLTSELVRETDKLVYSFTLEAYYEEPPADMIQTVPLFAKGPE